MTIAKNTPRNGTPVRTATHVLLSVYAAITFALIPGLALVLGLQGSFGGPRPSDMMRVAAFISYWVAPILFGLWLLFSAIRLKRRGGEKFVRITLIVLAIINIAWPVALTAYTWVYSASHTALEAKRGQEAADRAWVQQQDNERLTRLAQQGEARGCKNQPYFGSGDHSYRIQDYINKVEVRNTASVYSVVLPGLRKSWVECAEGAISPAQYDKEYKALVAQKSSELFKQKFGQSEFVRQERYYKALQEKYPDQYVY